MHVMFLELLKIKNYKVNKDCSLFAAPISQKVSSPKKRILCRSGVKAVGFVAFITKSIYLTS